jgi:hypothetical protein
MSTTGWTIYALVMVAVAVFYIISMWMVFQKAGRPGWACIIPFYSAYVMLKIAGKPGWWLVLFFIPLVNIVVYIIMQMSMAEKFGQGSGFGVGLIFLPIVFYPILAFGDAKYQA